MNHHDDKFTTYYLGDFSCPTLQEIYLHSLAEEYHKRTEEHDRSVCTGPIKNGGILPANDAEMKSIIRNALSVKQEIKIRAYREHGIDGSTLEKAIQNYLAAR
jgi:hypothetical protein